MKQARLPLYYFTNKEMKAKRDGVTYEKNREEAKSALTNVCLISTSYSL